VILGEGNHRLAAARELGWDVVPVSVRRSSVAAELALDTEKLLPPLEQLGDLPQTISPSQVGMPTAGGVARETGESTARTVDDPELANALSQRVISFSLHGGENERIIRAALEQAPFNKATLYKGATKYDYADQIKSGRVTFENSTSTSLDESVARQFAAEGERPLTTPEYRRWATGEVPARIDPYAPLDKPVLFEIPPDQTRSLDVTARVKEARDAELAQKGIFPTPIDDTGRGGYSVGHGGLGPSPVDEYLDYTIGSEGQMEHLIAGSFKVDEIVDEGTFLRVRLVREETASGVARETGGKPAAPTSAVDDLPVPEEYLGDLRALHEKGTGELIIANPTVGDLVAKADELEGEFWAKIEPGFESSAENIYVSVKGGGPQSIFRELASSHVSGIPIPNIVSDKWTPELPKQLYDLRAWDAPTHPGLFERQQRLANEAGDDLWEAYVDDFLTRYPDQDPIIVLSQEVKAHGPPGPTGGIITSPIPAWSHLDAIGQSVQEWLDGYALRKTARTIMEGGK